MLVQPYPSVRGLRYAVLPACQHTYLHTCVHPVCVEIMCFGGDVALESDLQGGWDLMLSKLACYC